MLARFFYTTVLSSLKQPSTIQSSTAKIRQQILRGTQATTQVRNMAGASKLQISVENVGIYHRPGITTESAEKVTQLLQKNHEEHHIFFNNEGFHVYDTA